MRVAGLEASLLPGAELPFATTGALVLPGQLQIDPGSYARAALAREAEATGVRIHEHSTVQSASWTEPLELRVDVPDPGGSDRAHRVTANRVVLDRTADPRPRWLLRPGAALAPVLRRRGGARGPPGWDVAVG